jgi:hypothetical protein
LGCLFSTYFGYSKKRIPQRIGKTYQERNPCLIGGATLANNEEKGSNITGVIEGRTGR